MGDNPHAGHRILYFHWRAFIYRMSNGAVCIALTLGVLQVVNGSLLELLASSGTLFFLDKPEFLQNEPKPSRPNWSRRELILIWGKTHTTQCWCYKIKTIYIYVFV